MESLDLPDGVVGGDRVAVFSRGKPKRLRFFPTTGAYKETRKFQAAQRPNASLLCWFKLRKLLRHWTLWKFLMILLSSLNTFSKGWLKPDLMQQLNLQFLKIIGHNLGSLEACELQLIRSAFVSQTFTNVVKNL